jgi:predicted AlkP superfamily phosphohydrolase/phosphomutase
MRRCRKSSTIWGIDVPARVLMLGLDGATLDLIEPWAADGSLPNLARLMAAGAWGRLRSTTPPATFPAWTSLMTGVNPGQHGIYDFTRRLPGTYRVEFLNATYRRRPSAWRLLSAAGRRVAVIGLPATYPPEALNGLLISGFDAPLATGIDRSFVQPPELYDEIRRVVGRYEITDFQELRIGPGWHEMALQKLLHAAGRRTQVAAYLLDRELWDCFFVHFGESDTVAHHFWALADPGSPRYDRERGAGLGHAIHTVYCALDRAVGELLARAAGDASSPESTVLIVSDHGSGGTGERVVHLNRWLEQQGWLRFAPPRPAGRAAAGFKRLGLALPASLQEWAFRGPLCGLAGRLESGARLGGIDWAATRAFSEEVNTLPAIWLNVRGREPQGVVAPGAAYEQLRDEILARLAAWRDPASGEPVVARAWRREELYHGPAVAGAPDIVLEPALDASASCGIGQGYAYTFLSSRGQRGEPIRRLAPDERLGAKGGSMNGSHRPDGVLILAGAGVRPGVQLLAAHIVDVAPTLLHLLDVALPADLDGRVLAEALLPAGPLRVGGPGAGELPPPNPYSAAQAAAVRERLRGLGYQS